MVEEFKDDHTPKRSPLRQSMTPLSYQKDLTKSKSRYSMHWFNDETHDDLQHSSQAGRVMPTISESAPTHQPEIMDEIVNSNMPSNFIVHGDEVLDGPLAFVETHEFQSIVAVVIVGNAVIIGFETDVDSPIWYWVEQGMLIFFVFELVCRVIHSGHRFIDADHRLGNIVDVVIVMSGAIDMWVVPVFEELIRVFNKSTQKHRRNPILQAMGILRMLRIIRLVRLVKIVQPLYRLATGVLEAMQGMFWVLVFLGMLLYAVAIVCTRLIGHGAVLQDQEHLDADVQEIKDMFNNVPDSMFVLFELMSCWSLIPLTPLFERLPIFKLLFVLFYIFAAWALLAVMTGVVSEKMIAVREQITSEEKDSNKRTNYVDLAMLNLKFRQADSNNDISISREEFNAMLGDATTMKSLMHMSNVNAQDLSELFDWLDSDKDNRISAQEFIDGFRWLNETVSPKSFVKLQEKLSSDLRALEVRLVGFINDRFDELIKAVRAPLRKINAVTTQVQRLDATCSEMSQLLRQRAKVRLTRAGLAEVERRLSSRIDALGEAVEQLAELQAAGLVKVEPRTSESAREATRGSLRSEWHFAV